MTLEQLIHEIEAKYPSLDIFVSQSKWNIYIHQIRLPKELQNQGIGSEILKRIKDYARTVNLPIVLSPEADRSKKAALDRFYRNNGFVYNKGRNRDYRFNGLMLWKTHFKEWLNENTKELINKAYILSKENLSFPRFQHAQRVANLLINPTEIEYAAALCHDLLEDTRLPYLTLVQELGEKVAKIVKELTNKDVSYIRDYSYFKRASLEAKKIKLADRIDNISKKIKMQIFSVDLKFILDYIQETKNLLDILKGSEPTLESLLQNLIINLKNQCNSTFE